MKIINSKPKDYNKVAIEVGITFHLTEGITKKLLEKYKPKDHRNNEAMVNDNNYKSEV